MHGRWTIQFNGQTCEWPYEINYEYYSKDLSISSTQKLGFDDFRAYRSEEFTIKIDCISGLRNINSTPHITRTSYLDINGLTMN